MDALQEVSELGGQVGIDGSGDRPGAWRTPPSPHAIPSSVPVAAVGLGIRARMRAKQVATQSARLDRGDALILLYAALAALCRPLTAPAVVVVLLPGAALLALAAWRRVPPRRAVCPRRCVVPWVVLALLFGGWELTATLWGNDSAHPTFSLLLDPVLATYPGRLLGWLVWLGVGRWLVTR